MNSESDRRRRAANRAWLDEIKLSRGCIDCGYRQRAEALQFDHREGEAKLFQVGTGNSRKRSLLQAEVDKCDVRCANCHAVETRRRNQYHRGSARTAGRPNIEKRFLALANALEGLWPPSPADTARLLREAVTEWRTYRAARLTSTFRFPRAEGVPSGR